MSSSRVAVTLGVVLVVFAFALSSITQQAPTSPIGTYQLVPAQYSMDGNEQHSVFLVDSKTGQVWEYLPPGKSADGKFRNAMFVMVEREPGR